MYMCVFAFVWAHTMCEQEYMSVHVEAWVLMGIDPLSLLYLIH